MKQLLFAANWKMHNTIAQASQLALAIKTGLFDCPHRIVLAPAFTSLASVSMTLKGAPKGSTIALAAQNMGPEEKGAHTGEVSVLMLQEVGVEYVILGHSERRSFYKENDSLINKKILLALSYGINPILCVGESLAERDSGQLESVLTRQLQQGLQGVGSSQISSIIVAYEPVWAIGTGRTAKAQDAQDVHSFIRKHISALYGPDKAASICIIYGGSVKPDNSSDLMSQPDIGGALVGGASLQSDSFIAIARCG